MKAKKLFPDLSFKRLWDKIKDLEDKVDEGSDINLDELNKNFEWKLVGSAVGTTAITLPNEYREIFVKTISRDGWLNATFYFIKEELNDDASYYVNGYYATPTVTSFIRVNANKTQIELTDVMESGNTYTSETTIKVYYR